jgi:hypothetical protein
MPRPAPQVRSLARAVFGAYREQFGVAASEVTSEGYSGEYVAELAKKVAETSGDRYVDLSPEAAATALTPLVVSLMQAEQEENAVPVRCALRQLVFGGESARGRGATKRDGRSTGFGVSVRPRRGAVAEDDTVRR